MSERLSTDSVTRDTSIEPVDFRLLLISGLSAVIGILAGLIAYVLYNMIALLTNLVYFRQVSFIFRSPHMAGHIGPWMILAPAAGGLLVGVMARYGTTKIQGHGIPEAMEAVMTNRSRISPRVAILKPLSAAIAIGSGGPFGAEGPIIQTGGAMGSVIGQFIRTTAAERKVLLAAGAAAGMAATFSTPIAGVILSIELLLFEFKSRSFIPLVIASTLATSVHLQLLGRGPMFSVGAVDFGIPSGLPYYVVLGLLCGVAAKGVSSALYWVEDLFEKLPVSWVWWPAIGGLALGIIGYFVPRVLGVGYDVISDILNNRLPLTILLLVMVFKTVALLVSLGSGTSGGLLAPMFMAGAAMGGAYAVIINHLIPGAHLSPGAYALAAMAAVFGAASRAAFTFIIFAFEITRDYNSVLPLMLVTVIADGVALIWMRNSIMTEKLARRGLRMHHEYEADVIQQANVGDVMLTDPACIPTTMRVSALLDAIGRGDPTLSRHHGLCIVDNDGHLAGIITHSDALRAAALHPGSDQTVMEAGSNSLVVTYADEPLHDAVLKMLRFNIGRLPVVDREFPGRVVGYLGRTGILEARKRQFQDEHVREEPWLADSTRRRLRMGASILARSRGARAKRSQIRARARVEPADSGHSSP